MEPKKILMLYSHGKQIVTGGQKYEDMLFRIWRDNPAVEIERVWLENINGRLRRHTAWLRNLSLLRKVRRYDLVIFNSAHWMFFIPLARMIRLLGGKVAIIHHHFIYMDKTGLRRWYYKNLESAFLKASTVLAVPSPYIDALCKEWYPKKQRCYWQIPFAAASPTAKPTPVAGNLLYIGTVEPRKGLKYLMEAMVMLKQRGTAVRLTVIGKTVDSGYRAMLDKMIADNGLDVRFTGYISQDEKDRIVANADIFTFPSLLEGYGMVICESMVNGLPVVCFDNSAMPYTVTDGVNGLLVADRDSEALARGIERVVTDRSLRDKLSAGAVATASGFMSADRFRTMVNRDLDAILAEKR